MEIETERLTLTVLNPAQLRNLTENLPSLERELGCVYRAEPIEGHFLAILKGQLPIAEKDPGNCPWHSFWLLIRKHDRVVVGSADFKAPPDEKGEVEIGYGLGQKFEHQGYMTEAVKAMCRWALRQTDVVRVLAETCPDNQASQQVLQRCGFSETGRAATVRWELREAPRRGA